MRNSTSIVNVRHPLARLTSFYYSQVVYDNVKDRLTTDSKGDIQWSLSEATAADKVNRNEKYYTDEFEYESCILFMGVNSDELVASPAFVQHYCFVDNAGDSPTVGDYCIALYFEYNAYERDLREYKFEITTITSGTTPSAAS